MYKRTLYKYTSFSKAIFNFNIFFYNNSVFFKDLTKSGDFYYSTDELLLVHTEGESKKILKKIRLNRERFFYTYSNGRLSLLNILKQFFIPNKGTTFCLKYKRNHIILYDNSDFFKMIKVKDVYEQNELYSELSKCVYGLRLYNYIFLGDLCKIYEKDINEKIKIFKSNIKK